MVRRGLKNFKVFFIICLAQLVILNVANCVTLLQCEAENVGNALDVSVRVANTEYVVKKFNVEVILAGSDSSIFARNTETVLLDSREVKDLSFSLTLPEKLPRDNYKVYCKVYEFGKPLTWLSSDVNLSDIATLPKVSFEKTVYLKVIQIQRSDTIVRRIVWYSYSDWGREIPPSAEIRLIAPLINKNPFSIKVKGLVKAIGTYSGNVIFEKEVDIGELEGNARKVIEIPISITIPGTYRVVIEIYDLQNNLLATSECRAVIMGEGGTILSIENKKDVYKKGDEVEINVTVVGPADKSIVSNAYLLLEIYRNNEEVFSENKTIDLTFKPESFTFKFRAKEDLLKYKVVVKLGKDGRVFDEEQIEYYDLEPEIILAEDGRVKYLNANQCFDDGICDDFEKKLNCMDCISFMPAKETGEETPGFGEKVEVKKSNKVYILVALTIILATMLFFKFFRRKEYLPIVLLLFTLFLNTKFAYAGCCTSECARCLYSPSNPWPCCSGGETTTLYQPLSLYKNASCSFGAASLSFCPHPVEKTEIKAAESCRRCVQYGTWCDPPQCKWEYKNEAGSTTVTQPCIVSYTIPSEGCNPFSGGCSLTSGSSSTLTISGGWICPMCRVIGELRENVLEKELSRIGLNLTSIDSLSLGLSNPGIRDANNIWRSGENVTVTFSAFIEACVDRIPMLGVNASLLDGSNVLSTEYGIFVAHQSLNLTAGNTGILENFTIPEQQVFRKNYTLKLIGKGYKSWAWRRALIEAINKTVEIGRSGGIPGWVNLTAKGIYVPTETEGPKRVGDIYFSESFVLGQHEVPPNITECELTVTQYSSCVSIATSSSWSGYCDAYSLANDINGNWQSFKSAIATECGVKEENIKDVQANVPAGYTSFNVLLTLDDVNVTKLFGLSASEFKTYAENPVNYNETFDELNSSGYIDKTVLKQKLINKLTSLGYISPSVCPSYNPIFYVEKPPANIAVTPDTYYEVTKICGFIATDWGYCNATELANDINSNWKSFEALIKSKCGVDGGIESVSASLPSPLPTETFNIMMNLSDINTTEIFGMNSTEFENYAEDYTNYNTVYNDIKNKGVVTDSQIKSKLKDEIEKKYSLCEGYVPSVASESVNSIEVSPVNKDLANITLNLTIGWENDLVGDLTIKINQIADIKLDLALSWLDDLTVSLNITEQISYNCSQAWAYASFQDLEPLTLAECLYNFDKCIKRSRGGFYEVAHCGVGEVEDLPFTADENGDGIVNQSELKTRLSILSTDGTFGEEESKHSITVYKSCKLNEIWRVNATDTPSLCYNCYLCPGNDTITSGYGSDSDEGTQSYVYKCYFDVSSDESNFVKEKDLNEIVTVYNGTKYACVNLTGSRYNSSAGKIYWGSEYEKELDSAICEAFGHHWDDDSPYNTDINFNKCCDKPTDNWCHIYEGGVCLNGTWYDNHCENNIKDDNICNEEDVDCGINSGCGACISAAISQTKVEIPLGQDREILLKIGKRLKEERNITITIDINKGNVKIEDVSGADPDTGSGIFKCGISEFCIQNVKGFSEIKVTITLLGAQAGTDTIGIKVCEKGPYGDICDYPEKSISVDIVEDVQVTPWIPVTIKIASGINTYAIILAVILALAYFSRCRALRLF